MNSELFGQIEKSTGRIVSKHHRIFGGDSAQAWKVDFTDGGSGFLKTVSEGRPFHMEALGLKRLSCEGGMRVPAVWDVSDTYLLLEWIEFRPPPIDFQPKMGQALARTHLECRGKIYGFVQDHTIGRSPQINTPQITPEPGSWAKFWWTHRLQPMFNRTRDKNLMKKGEILAAKLPELLSDPVEAPSLLHGDLWSGNVGADSHGAPVMFDPAPSYGHPEADLGMTRMFGGFTQDFYDGYNKVNPLDSGWEARLNLYMLYHVLNHACIFGGPYPLQASSILAEYL